MLWWRGQAAALRDSGKCHAHQEGLDAMRASALEICSNEKGFLKSKAMQDTIALVDDDRNILTSVSIALEAEGFKVSTSRSEASRVGKEAARTCKSWW